MPKLQIVREAYHPDSVQHVEAPFLGDTAASHIFPALLLRCGARSRHGLRLGQEHTASRAGLRASGVGGIGAGGLGWVHV